MVFAHHSFKNAQKLQIIFDLCHLSWAKQAVLPLSCAQKKGTSKLRLKQRFYYTPLAHFDHPMNFFILRKGTKNIFFTTSKEAKFCVSATKNGFIRKQFCQFHRPWTLSHCSKKNCGKWAKPLENFWQNAPQIFYTLWIAQHKENEPKMPLIWPAKKATRTCSEKWVTFCQGLKGMEWAVQMAFGKEAGIIRILRRTWKTWQVSS